ncbi:glucodextranase DOMON-like domain-containing protein [Saccharothrix mutabilis subsp. mutabilis]|uniref:Glucodextranase DOMON-like domain-containing protein n=1 Tax=Saccharothrix mutabilis subsp. mutabilis TaxID=66855 RepID=A0ABP3EF85_9PSEU
MRPPRPRAAIALAAAACLLSAHPAAAQPAVAQSEPPGAPGAAATWTTGDKDGIGTSTTTGSKVWYTLTDGTLSEIYYPSADTPNSRSLEFVVTDGKSFAQRETESTTRTTALVDQRSLTYRQTATDTAGRWTLTKTYITDPASATVLVDVDFRSLKDADLRLYVLFDPQLAGDSGNDTGRATRDALTSVDTHLPYRPVAAALVSGTGFTATSTGYAGASDGLADITANYTLTSRHPKAGPGNIAQVAQLPTGRAGTRTTLAIGFAVDEQAALTTARASLHRPFEVTKRWYQLGWHLYTASLKAAPKQLSGDLLDQYWASVMAVKAHEDKTHPGAFSASLTIPWGQAVPADGASGGGTGYHFVWARDMYHQVSALLAAGDTAAARRAVDWLFTRQQRPDGSFPQNSKVDGTPDQTNVQLDETAFPILLAWQTKRFDAAFYRDHIAKAADYLVEAGPKTPQERWEETGGYSPSTLAAQIAALTAAADIAHRAGDPDAAALYRATADSWQRQAERWMVTTTGPLGDGEYYIRISGSGDPDDGATRNWANGAGVHPENALVDAGFLELVRLGVKAPDDPAVAGSLPEVDASIKVSTPSGELWKRYTHDGYGETADGAPWTGVGIGRPWPLLSGERGEYELAGGRDALPYLRTMAATANSGRMIPEQVWDQADPTRHGHVFGKGTGSAAPLAWAMAQYVRLAQGIAAGRPVETPSVVADRYRTGPVATAALTLDGPEDLSTATGRTVRVHGNTNAPSVVVAVGPVKKRVAVTGGRFSTEVDLTGIDNTISVAAVGRDGATAYERRTVLSYGERVGGLTDPVGDDHGPGTYVYPTNSAFTPDSFDLTRFDVFRDGDSVRFVTRVAGAITNPWGGNGMSVQRVNILLCDPASDARTAPGLPGTNTATGGTWQRAVVADGRYADQPLSLGVYDPALTKVSAAELRVVPATHDIVVTVPASALGLDIATAGYQVSIYSNAEPGEGIGLVRPVYSKAHWDNGFPWTKEFRFGGGAGEQSFDLPSRDTDTRDPNTIDAITGDAAQSTVLDWTTTIPVVLPFVNLRP